ncbi:hypothetical protein [Novosphingobium aquimarinum]|uniref:hypothetical protein n=1 Tax=Novosphingobium aquimarinum TaxID=2682494 RepID=UPI0012EBFB63|nr:hypothetical protein [Novosphingobium aquimarinum]
MNGGSIEQELARIDAAIARVESAARSPSERPQSDDIHERHETLKAAVSRTIAEIDAMIAAQSG